MLSPSKKMFELYAAGFNAHGQLSGISKSGSLIADDIHRFQAIAVAERIDVLSANWSNTVFIKDSNLVIRGYCTEAQGTRQELSVPLEATVRCCFYTNKPSQVGIVSNDGSLYLLVENDDLNKLGNAYALVLRGNADSPRLSAVAATTTGRLCIAFLQSPASQLVHLLEFPNYSDFIDWYDDPSASSAMHESGLAREAPIHHMVQGKIYQLEAGTVFFVLHTEAGEIYTWTPDARHYRCLGRDVTSAAPAGKPGLVDALGGVPIGKVAVGGWMAVALSREGDAYVWGREQPRETENRVEALPEDGEGVKLVELSEERDIKDVAAGSSHLILLTEDSRVLVTGDNQNGQLSLSNDRTVDFTKGWMDADGLEGKCVKGIWCGDHTSLALVET